MEEYITLSGNVFKTDSLPYGIFGATARFNAKSLEDQLKSVVSSRWADGRGNVQSPDGNKEPLEDPLGEKCCKTFVLAVHADVASGIPSRLRTYLSKQDHPTRDCTIWQAGRATSAAPTFFDPVTFGVPPIRYVDAGLGYNNPSREALGEALRIWTNSKVEC